MRSRQHAQAGDAIRMMGGGRPSDLSAPVVTDEVRPLESERIEDVEHIGHQTVEPVCVDLLRPHSGRVAPLVWGNCAETMIGKCRKDALPGSSGLREAVQQDHARVVDRSSNVGAESAFAREDLDVFHVRHGIG